MLCNSKQWFPTISSGFEKEISDVEIEISYGIEISEVEIEISEVVIEISEVGIEL